MLKTGQERLRAAALLMVVPLMASCAPAVGAAAGAAAAIVYDDRNASAEITAPVATIVAATESTFEQMGITEVEREIEQDGENVEIHARSSEGDVTVDIESNGPGTTEVVVTVRDNQVEYKPGYAGQILEQILARAN